MATLSSATLKLWIYDGQILGQVITGTSLKLYNN